MRLWTLDGKLADFDSRLGRVPGVGKLAEGDIVEVEIVGLSMVTNPVAAPSV